MGRARGALLLAAPLMALAACEPAPQPEPLEPPAPPAAAVPMGPGLYAIGEGAAVYVRTRLSEDGTYADLDESGAQVGSGRWRSAGATVCFDPEGEAADQQERCWSNAPPGTDGSFMTTRDDGSQSYKVTPLAE